MESIWQPQILSLETSGDNSPRITALPPLPQALPPAPPHMDPNYAPVRRSRHDSAYTTNSTSRSSSRMSKSGGSTGGGGYTCPITGIQLFGRSKKAALKENLTPEEEIAQLKEVIESFESDLTRSSDTIVRQDKQIVRLESQMAYYKSKATVNTSPLMGSSESTVGGSDTSGSEQDSSSSGRRSISMMSMSDASSVHDLRVYVAATESRCAGRWPDRHIRAARQTQRRAQGEGCFFRRLQSQEEGPELRRRYQIRL